MARRVNTRFVTILLMSSLGLGAAVWVAQNFLIRDHADVHMRAAQQDLSSKPPKLDDAVIELNKAARLSPRDVKVQLLLGNVYRSLAVTDQANIGREKDAFDKVLGINPENLEALRALIVLCEDPSSGRSAELYDMAAGYARRAAKADADVLAEKASKTPPESVTLEDLQDLQHLQTLPAMTVVQKSQLGLYNDPAEIQPAIDTLQGLMDQYKKNLADPEKSKINPINAEVPFYIAQGKYQQAVIVITHDDSHQHAAQSNALLDSAVNTFTDPNLLPMAGDPTTRPDTITQDDSAEMHYRYARVLEEVAGAQRLDPTKQKANLDKAQEQSDRARALVKKDDGLFTEINLYAVDLYAHRGRIQDAIRILRALPDGLNGYQKNFALGNYLGGDPETRPEAIKLLGDAIEAMGGMDRMTAYTFRFIDLQTRLQIEDYGLLKDPAEKKKLGDEIDYSLSKMKERRGNTPDFTTIQKDQAQFYLADLNYVDAIPILQSLVATNQYLARDPQVLVPLAEAYEKAGQSADAINYFSKLVAQYPDRVELRKPLVHIMIQHSPDQVESQLEALERMAPKDPEVIFDRIDVLSRPDPMKNKDRIQECLKNIPETTDTEIAQKSRREIVIQDWDEAARLLSMFLSKYPGDSQATRELAAVYERLNQKDKAVEVVNSSLKVNPENLELQETLAVLKGAKQEDINKLFDDKIKNDTDPGSKALKLAEKDNRANDLAKAEADLLEGEKNTTDTTQMHQIWTELFQIYIRTKKFNAAQTYLDKIAKANLDRVGGELYRFKLMQAMGKNDTELEIARQIAKEYPDFAPVWMDLGDALRDNNDPENAIIQYSAALAKQPDNLQGIVGIVQCDYAMDKRDEALAEIKLGLTKIPDNSDLRMLLLKHEYTYGNYDEAMTAVNNELRRQSDNRELWAAQGMLFYKGGRIAEADNNMDLAKERYKSAMDTLDKARQMWPNDGVITNAMVDLLVETRNFGEAEKVLQQWSEDDDAEHHWKTRPEPFQKMATFYDQMGQNDLAEKAMQVAYTNSGYQIGLQLQMADLLSRHKKFDVALALLEATNSDKPNVRRAIIVTLAQMDGRFPEAEAKLQEALNSNPARPANLLTLWAQLLLNQKNFPGAIDKAKQALDIDPKDTEAHYIRASAYFFENPPDNQAALTDLNMMGASPDAKVHMMKADCYLRQNSAESATAELESALKSAPQNKLVRMKLVQIYTTGARQRTPEAMLLLKDAEAMPEFQKDPEIYKTEADILMPTDLAGAMQKSKMALQLTSPKDSEAYSKVLRQYLDVLVKVNPAALLSETEGSKEVNQHNWWFMLDRGLSKQEINDKDGALVDLKTALADSESDKDSAAAPAVLDAIVKQVGVDQAIAMVRPVATSHATARVTLALLLMRKGQTDEAVSQADSVMSEASGLPSPDDKVRIYSTLPRVYLAASPHPLVDSAVICYQKALEINPTAIVNLNDLACVLVDMYTPPRAKEALVYAQRAVDTLNGLEHHDATIQDANINETLGWVTIQSGDVDKGISILLGVIRARPFPTACLHLGEGYLKAGHPDAGLAQANDGLRLEKADPKNLDTTMETKLADLKARCTAAMKPSASN